MRKTAYLTNSDHIKCILTHSIENSQSWELAWNSVYSLTNHRSWITWIKAQNMAWNDARLINREADRLLMLLSEWKNLRKVKHLADPSTEYNESWDPVRFAAFGAASSLVAWDHAGKYMNMQPDHLRVWYELSNDPACLLMLPASFAMQTNELAGHS